MSEPKARKMPKKNPPKPIGHTLKIDKIGNQVENLKEIFEQEIGALKNDNARLHTLLAEQNSLIQERNIRLYTVYKAYVPQDDS